MPRPKPNEKRSDYIARAVSTIKREEPEKPIKEGLGKAFGMWKTYGKGVK